MCIRATVSLHVLGFERVAGARGRFIPVRSPVKRLLEVLLLVLVTSSLWFGLSYSSPCHTLPNPVSAHHTAGAQLARPGPLSPATSYELPKP